jgi:hypothetical protein
VWEMGGLCFFFDGPSLWVNGGGQLLRFCNLGNLHTMGVSSHGRRGLWVG